MELERCHVAVEGKKLQNLSNELLDPKHLFRIFLGLKNIEDYLFKFENVDAIHAMPKYNLSVISLYIYDKYL